MDKITSALRKLEEKGRLRELSSSGGIDFTTNDYLGLRRHPALREAAIAALEGGMDIGAGGARVLGGNDPAHESLEQAAAAFFGCGRALFFSTGFLANIALYSSLPERQDVILFDALVHASIRDGIQANPARHFRFAHNDLNALEDLLKKNSAARLWVAIDSVYSMDGDIAPLRDMVALCRKYGAFLVADEAHGTGVFGTGGRGLAHGIDYEKLITLHTCGKALGVAGALICASAPVIELLVNRAKSFLFSTAPMPLQAHLVEKALALCEAADGRRAHLQKLCKTAEKAFGFSSPTPIFPYILDEDTKATTAARFLREHGFDIRAVRPPTVPEGTARLRITLNALRTEDEVAALGQALAEFTAHAAA